MKLHKSCFQHNCVTITAIQYNLCFMLVLLIPCPPQKLNNPGILAILGDHFPAIKITLFHRSVGIKSPGIMIAQVTTFPMIRFVILNL